MGGKNYDKKTIWNYLYTIGFYSMCRSVISKIKPNGLTDPTDLSQVLAGEGEQADKKADAKVEEKEAKEKAKKDDKETLGSQDYFFSQRSTKEQQNSATTQKLKSIIEDTNISQEKKDIATTELQEKTMIKDNEGRIELNVKNKGFEDVLCFIEGNKVRVVLKAEEQLTEEQTCAIQEIVEDVSNMSEVIIEPKK